MAGEVLSDQRKEEVLLAAIMVILDLWPPDLRPVVFAKISAKLLERLSRRDTRPSAYLPPIPREDE